ncbi:MAG: hypothetical protein KDA65_09660 [Planctomycetaceae bacterium]|nr:hypothetical protein [Planctomycetaceae bacterium]
MELFYAGTLGINSDDAISSLTDQPLRASTLTDLQAAIDESKDDLIGLADAAFVPERVAWEAAAIKVEQGNISAVVLHPAEGLIADIWSQISPLVAALAISPTHSGAVLISREALASGLQALTVQGEVRDPLWAVLVSLAAEGKLEGLPQGAAVDWGTLELPGLAPSTPGRQSNWLKDAIRECCANPELGSPDQRTYLRAALYQLNDYLDASHQASQSMEGDSIADHWHAIMHRREPDYGNSKYWYRRVGYSPLFDELNERATQLQQSMPEAASLSQIGAGQQWDSFGFVDFCADCARNRDTRATALAKQIQYVEMLLLLQQSL